MRLRVADEFWRSCSTSNLVLTSTTSVSIILPVQVDSWISQSILFPQHPTLNQINDGDPYDHITDGPELGILLRTDYSNEDAWKAFFARLQESEKAFLEDLRTNEGETASQDTSSGSGPYVASTTTTGDADMDSDSDSDAEDEQTSILKVVNATSLPDRMILSNISNLAALRLFNEVDVKPSPTPPAGTRRINPPNRLLDHGGWQEIYEGKSIWIYDGQSNSDQSVRVVSQQGNIYGTAT